MSKKKIRIVVSPNMNEGKAPTFSVDIYLSTLGSNGTGGLGSILMDFISAKPFLNEEIQSRWGGVTSDFNFRYKRMPGVFESPEVAITHATLLIDEFFGKGYDFESVLLNETKIISPEVQNIPLHFVGEN